MGDNMHATHILWHAAGQPEYPQEQPGICRICGEQSAGVAFHAWVRDTFTNHDDLQPGDIICSECLFLFDQGSILLAKKVEKWWRTEEEAIAANSDRVAAWQKKHKTESLPSPKEIGLAERENGWCIPQRMQNYSHIVLRGEWHPLHKGQKAELLALLRQEPELVAIGTSGQKHIVFRARPGWWQVEEQRVAANVAALDACLAHVNAFYTVFSKAEIETGHYSPGRTLQYAQAHGLEAFVNNEAALKQWRGTLYFELAVYLAQKEESNEQDKDRSGAVPGTVPGGAVAADSAVAGAGQRVQTAVRTQHLGTVREQHQGRGVHVEPEQVLQLDLFQAGDPGDS